jgi:hypothetical protein
VGDNLKPSTSTVLHPVARFDPREDVRQSAAFASVFEIVSDLPCNRLSKILQFLCNTKSGSLVIDLAETWVNLGLILQFSGKGKSVVFED